MRRRFSCVYKKISLLTHTHNGATEATKRERDKILIKSTPSDYEKQEMKTAW